ncbi:flagellar motor protein MotB [Cohnella kolymensis]|uniref:Flagellar motor protein MotB n=1 Tax=Cohnella kolymensis TaxID=1590652 RepID=A0ABR5A1W3_9BACL|nr:flagellar motor protein MotB [Cohnella kolymensis]KIL34540.1 flagellar motor protein MotB [Cohnella kolymensis]
MSSKRHEPHEEHADESWLLPYSDLMTLLLALFIVLYAASAVNTSKFDEMSRAFRSAFNSGLGVLDKNSVMENDQQRRRSDEMNNKKDEAKTRDSLRKQEQQNLEELKKQLDRYIQKNGLSSQLQTELNTSELLITIRDNALFASGSAGIKTESQKLAAAIGEMLQGYPDYDILVTGHTDDQPINTKEFPSNWELSSKRAINFMKILLENDAFDPKRFSATGYGEFRPVDTSGTNLGRAKNRRVEVSVLRKYSEPASNSEQMTMNAIANEGKPK